VMYQWSKDIVQWRCGRTLYLSVVFSWQVSEAMEIARQYGGPVVAGGPALAEFAGSRLGHMRVEAWTPFDVLALHNPLATFTTRGCVRMCPFCAVPKNEGAFRELADWRPAPLVCDNNFLAASMRHIKRAVDRLKVFPYVDFNQGLDARLFTAEKAGELARLQGVKVRFALDNAEMKSFVARAIETARKAGLKDLGVYVLIGFDDTPEEARDRLEWVRMFGIRPNPMRYQPLRAVRKNEYVAPGWSEAELRKMMKYYSRLRWLEHVPYEEFDYLACGEEGEECVPWFSFSGIPEKL
jgi:hypothetical protein